MTQKEYARSWYLKNREIVLARARDSYVKNKDKKRAYDIEYAKSDRGKEVRHNAVLRQRSGPEWDQKFKARYTMGNAIRDGRLKRGVCEVCGNTHVDGHHDDYSKPLDVRWLCRKHHYELHHKGSEAI